LWKPIEWIELGKRIHEQYGLKIVVVGAEYDSAYFDLLIEPLLDKEKSYWTSLIGKTNIGQLYGVTSQSQFMFSYQSGVGIVSTYLGTPTGIWWRPHGDSINVNNYLSFDEGMASAWVSPSIIEKGTHLPLIYGKHKVDWIMEEVRKRGWVHEKSSVAYSATRSVSPIGQGQ